MEAMPHARTIRPAMTRPKRGTRVPNHATKGVVIANADAATANVRPTMNGESVMSLKTQ